MTKTYSSNDVLYTDSNNSDITIKYSGTVLLKLTIAAAEDLAEQLAREARRARKDARLANHVCIGEIDRGPHRYRDCSDTCWGECWDGELIGGGPEQPKYGKEQQST